MSSRPVIKLALFDADDMIWRAYGPWAACMEPAINDLVRYLGADPEKLRHCIQNEAAGQHRFNDFGGLCHFLKQEKIIPVTGDEREDYERDIIRRNIRSRFFHDWRKLTVFYPQTLETLTKIKESGTATAIWTDSDAPTVIRRFDSACKNAGLSAQQQIEALKLIDAFYVMPSVECDSRILWNVDPDFIHAFKKKMMISAQPKAWKPSSPEPMENARGKAIMADFGVLPENTVMMGDSNKDVFAALQSGIHAAWFKKGADQDAKTVEMLSRYASPRYKYGLGSIMEQLALHAPDANYITLHESMAELLDHFTFAPAESAYRHSPLSQTWHIPLASAPLTQVGRREKIGARTPQELNALFGIATHLGAGLPELVPQGLADMAGLGTQGQPVAPLPV